MLSGGEELTMSNLIGRAQNILLTPKTEWPVIAAEPETTAGLYTKYILILSAIGPIAMFLRSTLIGISVPFVGTYKVGMGAALTQLVLMYALGLVGIFVVALIINALAPTFGGQKDSVQALKAAAYASTAGWVAGIGQILPWGIGSLIGIAGGIYCIYLLYLGLPFTMKSPAEKSAGYTAVTIIAAIILAIQVWGSYELIRNVFRWLALTLFTYVVAAFLASLTCARSCRARSFPRSSSTSSSSRCWSPSSGPACRPTCTRGSRTRKSRRRLRSAADTSRSGLGRYGRNCASRARKS